MKRAFFNSLRVIVLLGAMMGAALSLAAPAAAYEVSPLRIFLEPASGKRAATVSVNNTRDDALFIEVKVFRRVVERDGSQTLVPNDDAFVVFPPQRRIEPKSSQAVRIQFAGELQEGRSESYVVQITEVPVDQTGFSGVRFTYNFGVAVYVDPPRVQPKLLASAGVVRDGVLSFTVRNDGPAYGFTTGHALRMNSADSTVTIEPAELAERVSMPIIPPYSERDFNFPVEGLADGPLAAVELLDRTD